MELWNHRDLVMKVILVARKGIPPGWAALLNYRYPARI
jgi:hypothetical protein